MVKGSFFDSVAVFYLESMIGREVNYSLKKTAVHQMH